MTSLRLRGHLGLTSLAIVALVMAFSSVAVSQDIFQDRLKRALDQVQRATQAGQYDDAIKMLDQLDEQYPNDPAIYAAYRTAYVYSGQYEKALEALQKSVKLIGRTSSLMLQFGDVYLKMGNSKKASEIFDEALKKSRNSLNVYQSIAMVYRANGLYDKAVEVYKNARHDLNQPTLLSRELGQLYEVQRNYPAAVREYYNFMTQDSASEDQGNQLIRRLIEDVDNDDDLELLKKSFVDIGNSDKNSYLSRRFLGDILIRQDSLDAAFQLYKKVDELEGDHGRFLVYFAQRCLEQEHGRLAAEVCTYVSHKYPNEPYSVQADYVLASAYVQLGKGDSAISVVRNISEMARDKRTMIESTYLLGRIFLDYLNQPDSALVYFDQLSTGAQFEPWRNRAIFRKADCYLARGNLEIADSLYKTVDNNNLGSDEQELLAWKQAQVKFFEHDFDEAKKLYAGLTVKFRKGMYVNDCLRRVLMIDENTGFDQFDLASYADAEYLIVQADYDSAETRLGLISDKIGSNLADIATFRMGDLYMTTGDLQKALATYRKLLDKFPDSFYRAESQKQIADIYWTNGDYQQAEQAYRSLLTDYDNLLLQQHARERLMQLENM